MVWAPASPSQFMERGDVSMARATYPSYLIQIQEELTEPLMTPAKPGGLGLAVQSR